MTTASPSYLIIVTHPGADVVELWSAHCEEADATAMHERLERLLALTKSRAHLIAVPAVEGVVKADKPPVSPEPRDPGAEAGVSTPVVAPHAHVRGKFRRGAKLTLAEQVAQDELNAISGVGRDADDRIADVGVMT